MSTSTPEALPLLQGRYRIEDRLGASRLAVVYRAVDERLQRQVLVHVLRKELAGQTQLRERFLQEAQHSAGRSHRSLLDVFDTGDLAGRPFLVTEFVAGRALRELGALSLEDALLYFRQVVGAVAACQAAGIPHPPISSSNVILVEDGHVELLESWLVPPDEVPRDLASYRPPERGGGAPLTPAGAVYSLGLLLMEMISGKRPIDGPDARAVAQSHLTAVIPPLSQLQPKLNAPPLDDLVRRMTARDPQQRLPDAASVAQALDALYQQLSAETRRLAVPRAPSVSQQVRETTGRILRDPAAVVRAPLPRRQPQDDQPPRQANPGERSMVGLVIVGVLFLAVACGAWQLTSYAAEQLADVHLPRLELSAPDIGISLPEWLTGVVEGQGQVLEVSIRDAEGLNLRETPGLNTPVLGLLPNGTRVRRLEGPRIVDGVPWMRVRAKVGGREVEGWVSARYVQPV